MNKENCRECIFEENCSTRNKLECCEYYCSLNDDNDDMLIEYIESHRREFYAEWFRYVNNDNEEGNIFLRLQHN